MRSWKITFPFAPNSALFPNSRNRRGGFYPGVTAAKNERKRAGKFAQKYSPSKPFTVPLLMTVHAQYGYRRTPPDIDATIGACKPVIDGLTDAGVMSDDKLVMKLVVTHENILHKRGGPRHPGSITITIEELK